MTHMYQITASCRYEYIVWVNKSYIRAIMSTGSLSLLGLNTDGHSVIASFLNKGAYCEIALGVVNLQLKFSLVITKLLASRETLHTVRDVTWVLWRPKSPATQLLVEQFEQASNKDKINVLHYWTPLWGESIMRKMFPCVYVFVCHDHDIIHIYVCSQYHQ